VISEWEWRDSAGYSLPFNDQAVELYYNMRSTTTLPSLRSSAFVQDTWRNNFEKGLLTVTAGVRASHWSYNNEFFASPRVSVAYLPHWEKISASALLRVCIISRHFTKNCAIQ
jgi:hypothetical protein